MAALTATTSSIAPGPRQSLGPAYLSARCLSHVLSWHSWILGRHAAGLSPRDYPLPSSPLRLFDLRQRGVHNKLRARSKASLPPSLYSFYGSPLPQTVQHGVRTRSASCNIHETTSLPHASRASRAHSKPPRPRPLKSPAVQLLGNGPRKVQRQ
jgi:hypothetical protein